MRRGRGGHPRRAAPSAAPAPPAPVAAAPQLPAVEGEVIGFPGAPVPGLDAHYVTTELGWLGPDDDVVFEAVIRWTRTGELGCGILDPGHAVGVFRAQPGGATELLVASGDSAAGVQAVHAGVREARRPTATPGALIPVR
ncbi:MAG: hypothetical protein ACYSUM_20325 [Planctomycetota bacterium]